MMNCYNNECEMLFNHIPGCLAVTIDEGTSNCVKVDFDCFGLLSIVIFLFLVGISGTKQEIDNEYMYHIDG